MSSETVSILLPFGLININTFQKCFKKMSLQQRLIFYSFLLKFNFSSDVMYVINSIIISSLNEMA